MSGGDGPPDGDPPVTPFLPLPKGLADPRNDARVTFDHIADLYDTARPTYPPQAMADLQARCRLGPVSRVLEVGAGTGQATRALAAMAGGVDSLEPGPRLAALARRNLADFPHVRVIPASFEEFAGEEGRYDAVVAATSFHWIDPAVSFPKAAWLLRPGGSLALLSNAHAAGGTQARLASQVPELHARLVPEIGPWDFPTLDELRRRAEAGGDIAQVFFRMERSLSEPPAVSGLYRPPLVSLYPWLATYSTDGYVAMLATQSSYALLDPGRRAAIIGAIAELIDGALGGTVTKQYATFLITAAREVVPADEGT